MSCNLTSATSTTPLPDDQPPIFKTPTAAGGGGSLGGIPVKAMPTGSSKHPPTIQDIAQPFIAGYDRTDDINKTEKTYQEELTLEKAKCVSPATTERIERVEKIITILKRAADYQKGMLRHLTEGVMIGHVTTGPYDEQPNPPTGRRQLASMLNAIKINSRPNNIEKIVKQMEADDQAITDCQHRLVEIQGALHTETSAEPPNQNRIDSLTRQVHHLNSAIQHRRNVFNLRSTLEALPPLPFATINPETQADLERNKWNCAHEQALAQAEDFSQQALAAGDAGQHKKEIYLDNARRSHASAAQEAQKTHPREQVIASYTQAATLYQQAVEAEDTGQHQKAIYLSNAGSSLFSGAQEAQEDAPNPNVIEQYTQSASLFRNAVEAEDTGQHKKAMYLSLAGHSLYSLAQEAQEDAPNPNVIEQYTQSASLFRNAVEAEGSGQHEKAIYLSSAGHSLFYAAEEAQKTHPREQVIASYPQAATLFRNAVEAEDTGQHKKAIYLSSAGQSLYSLAQEAQKTNPQERVITFYTQAATLFQNSIEAENVGQHEKAIYLSLAGDSFFLAAQEAQKDTPEENIISEHVREANRCLTMHSAQFSCTIS